MENSGVKWVRLGDYIEQFKQKCANNEAVVSGVDINKQFISTRAKLEGTDISGYYLVPPRLIYSVFNCSPYVENYGGRVASVIAFGGKYRLRFRAACLTGRVPYIGRPSCGAAVYGVCQLNRMPMPAYMV